MKVRLSRRASQDIRDIGRYVRERSPAGALKVQGELRAALELLAQHPYAGRNLGAGLRRFAPPRIPYLVFYLVNVEADAVDVVTIRHAARTPEGG